MNQVRRILVALLLPSLSTAACIPFDQARNHLDETQCVTGKVIRVQEADEGIRYLDFCEDYRLCTFTVVVFPHDLKKIGDVRQLAGRVVEISGEIKEYDDRAEIVLESSKQLNSRLMRLSPLPKSFDVRLCPPIFRKMQSRTDLQISSLDLKPSRVLTHPADR
ncbi:MAG: hypothetical protein DMG92_07600 [Acidobacteria bacterium]|nr:MAG: hypothetical protein DMG92_07600 [Acidobacteriota bacterium]